MKSTGMNNHPRHELSIAENVARNVKLFNFDGADMRVVTIDGDPWFVAKDLSDALGYSWNGTARIAHVPTEWRGITSVVTPSGLQDMAVLSEQGMYFFLSRSDKSAALPMQKWVAGDVLPSIRKTGGYSVAVPAFAIPTTLSEALRLAADQAEQIEQQQAALAIAAPKAEFVDRYVDGTGLKGFRQVAKLLGAKENDFRAFLQDKHVMYRLGGEWVPFAEHIDAGRFSVKTGQADNGHAFNAAKFTPKGVQWIAGLWVAHQMEEAA